MNYLQKVDNARKLIRESIQRHPKICLGSSFGKDSMVLLHLTLSIFPDIPVFALLSDTEFPETYEFIRTVVIAYHLNYTEYSYKQKEGEKCCGIPKVETAKIALKNYDAWLSGVRKTEGITRANFNCVEDKNGLVKINPILDFTEVDIWRYLALNQIPINPMYKKGYRSLSCSRCSTPEVDETETEREGRWKGTPDHRGECGIHTHSLRS
jgi:phosphoadenosine phosphosulfate reductase